MTLELGVSAVQRALFVHAMANWENDAQEAERANHTGTFTQPLWQTMAYTGFRLFSPTGVSHCINEALAAAGCAAISSQLGWILVLTPAVTFLAAELAPAGAVRNTLQFAKNHLGTLLRTAMLVSQVAIYYFTQSHIALLSLAIQSILLLERNHWLPDRVSWVLSKGTLVALPLSNLISSGIWSVGGVNAIGELAVTFFLPWYQRKVAEFSEWLEEQVAQANHESAEEHSLDGKLEWKHQHLVQYSNRVTFSMNWNHVGRTSLPSIPSVDVRTLTDLWNACENKGLFADKDPIEVSRRKAQLVQVLSQVEAADPLRNLEAGYLRIIADQLPGRSSENQAAFLWNFARSEDLFLRNQVAQNQVALLVSDEPILSVNDKVFHLLQNLRTELYYFPANPSWYFRTWLWFAHRGMPNPLPQMNLKVANHVKSAEFLPGASSSLEALGYTIENVVAYVSQHLAPAELLRWKMAQPGMVQFYLGQKSDPDAVRFMLFSQGVLEAQFKPLTSIPIQDTTP